MSRSRDESVSSSGRKRPGRHTLEPQDFFNALIEARGLPNEVEKIPGAFVYRSVVSHSAQLRDRLSWVETLSDQDQSSFIKSLALYEQTIGGIGSATLLDLTLRAVRDPDHKLFDWVLINTSSYNYFARGAKSYEELRQRQEASRARAERNLEREAQRTGEARARRARKASSNLINAIRRGDIKAVEALLRQGASLDTANSDGLPAADYAEEIGHRQIALLLRNWRKPI